MSSVFFVGIGGFVGAALRYLISSWAGKELSGVLPFGTLIVNVLGGILIGFIMQYNDSIITIPHNMRLLLTTGIMGGLTTFSTFSYETVLLFGQGKIIIAFTNIFLNILLSVLGVYLGKYAIISMY